MDEIEKEMRNIVQSVKEVLECPVCYETMDQTLKQCVNGHGVCSVCATKLKNCPTCHQELPTLQQNTLLAKLLEHLPKPCPNTDKGCQQIVCGKNKNHQEFCEFRTTECKKPLCGWKGCAKDLIDHVKLCFWCNPYLFSNFNVEVKKSMPFPQQQHKELIVPIICQTHFFWMYVHKNSIDTGKSIFINLIYVKTSDDNTDYYMSICFKKGDIEFKCCCKATLLGDVDDSVGNKNGLIISDEMLQKLSTDTNDKIYACIFKLIKEDNPLKGMFY